MQTQINLRLLKAISLAASTEETRYYLNGVLIECRETRVTYVATNGHVMLVAQEDLPELKTDANPRLVGNWIIPNKVCLAHKPSKRDYEDIATLTRDGEHTLRLATTTKDATVFAPIDGAFPDWRRVLPREMQPIGTITKHIDKGPTNDGLPAQFNLNYLALFHKFENMAFPGRSKLSLAVINYTESESPHAVTFGGDERAFGVIMPMRKSPPSWTGAPSWVSDVYPNATAEQPTDSTELSQ